MTRPIIACDVDGVLADLDTEWLRRYNLESGDNLTPEKLTKWEIEDQVRPEFRTRIYEILKDPLIYSSVKPYPDALEAVRELRVLGRVVFVTSCPVEHLESKFHWLVTHGFLERKDIQDYIPCKDKWLVGADILIDDHVKNVNMFLNLDTTKKAVLVNRHHNQRAAFTELHACCRWPQGMGLKSAVDLIKSFILLVL